MRVLVTGCAGFIGYHFAERCLNDGHDVVGMDNITTGQEGNVASLVKHPNFTFVRHDVTAPLPDRGRFEFVCNFACPASPVDFSPRRLEILRVCSQGVTNLLELAAAQQAVFLQTSTSEVYGNPTVHPQPESYWGNVNPIGPRACYDEGKRFAEALVCGYRAARGVDTRIVRIFNTYGPRMRPNDGRALPNFINQALDHKPITIHGDGRQTRSFCFVSDLVEGISRLVFTSPDPSHGGQPVNIGNPAEVTVLDIAREVVRIVGSRSEIQLVERPQDDPQVRRPDITRATQWLGWKPIVERADGLAVTIEWFRRVRHAAAAAGSGG